MYVRMCICPCVYMRACMPLYMLYAQMPMRICTCICIYMYTNMGTMYDPK